MIKPDNLEEARILIVDDCEDTARTLADLLALRRCRTIHAATDAAAVCDLHLLNDYDLILLEAADAALHAAKRAGKNRYCFADAQPRTPAWPPSDGCAA